MKKIITRSYNIKTDKINQAEKIVELFFYMV